MVKNRSQRAADYILRRYDWLVVQKSKGKIERRNL